MVDAMSRFGYVVVALFLLMTVLTTACGREKPRPAKPFTVRMLSARSLSGRWERAAERGLGLIAAELDADVARFRVEDQDDARARLAEQGRAGVELVFCVGLLNWKAQSYGIRRHLVTAKVELTKSRKVRVRL